MAYTLYKNESVIDIVEEQERHYISEDSDISEHVKWSLKETVEKIEAYVNSVPISGRYDSLGREKPFFNIVTAAENIWYRATDTDRRNIRIKATKMADVLPAFIGTQKLRQWMKGTNESSNFGMFLNEWGRTLTRYGSALPKFLEVDGKLLASNTPWSRLILDNVSEKEAPIIELVEYTPAQLMAHKGYDKEVAKSLLSSLSPRENLDEGQKDSKAHYIKVYHVHGELPKALMLDNPLEAEDEMWETYSLQFHAVAYTTGKSEKRKDFFTPKGSLN